MGASGTVSIIVDDATSFRLTSPTVLFVIAGSVFLTLTEDMEGEGCSEYSRAVLESRSCFLVTSVGTPVLDAP